MIYLSFDEGNGSVVLDQSGKNNNGAVNDATWTPGVSGNALKFDGINDSVTIPNADVLESVNSITIAFWAKTAVQTHSGISHPYIVHSNGFAISQYEQIISIRISGYISSSTRMAQTHFNQNQWEFFTGTYNGTHITIYRNGLWEATTYHPETMFSGNTWRFLELGRYLGGGDLGDAYWAGELDELYIWNRAFSSSEVWELYHVPDPLSDILNMLTGINLGGIAIFLLIIIIFIFFKKK
jgi:hypothetical protein